MYFRPSAFTEVVKLFTSSSHLKSAQQTESEDPDEVLRSLDFEEQGAGYQAAYSKLAASETAVEDPVAYIGDTRDFVGGQLSASVKRDPRIRELLKMADSPVVISFLQALSSAGYAL